MKINPALQNWRRAASLAVIILAGAPALPQPATAQSVTNDAVLRSLVREIIVPGHQELTAKCQALRTTVADFGKAPTQASLDQARKAWVAASLATRRIQWLQSGPIADREYLASFYYAKVLPARIEEVVHSTRTIDEAWLGELGATTKGMFALEYLLFDRWGNPTAEGNPTRVPALDLFTQAESSRRHQYLLALAKDLEAKAGQLLQDWTVAGDQGVAAKFVAGGQESFNRVVNQLAQHLEQVAEQRLNFVLQLPPPVSRQLERIEGSLSGTSQLSALEMLRSAQTLYRGPGVGSLESHLKGLNAPLAERLRGQFETALAAVQAIGAPLEQAVSGNRTLMENAYEKTRSLEVVCKTDLASALGVTITFSSGDGD